MRSLLSVCSTRMASTASFTLRANVRSLVPSSMLRATCWVMVEAPIGRWLRPKMNTSVKAARAMRPTSTPLCVQKFWSSAETKACFTTSGMALIGMKMRRSLASSAIRRSSLA